MNEDSEAPSETKSQWSAGFSNIRCKGARKRRPAAMRDTNEPIACADLMYRVKVEGQAVVVECRCKECKTYSIRKFRPRRDEHAESEQ